MSLLSKPRIGTQRVWYAAGSRPRTNSARRTVCLRRVLRALTYTLRRCPDGRRSRGSSVACLWHVKIDDRNC